MNTRRVISVIIAAAVTAAALWAYAYRPAAAARPAPAAKVATVVPIADGSSIDFSNGKPVVGTSDADKASMDAAVKQIDEATKNVTFKAEPTPAK